MAVLRDIRSVRIKRIDAETGRFCVDCVWSVLNEDDDREFSSRGGGMLRKGTVAWIDRSTFEVSVRDGFEEACNNNSLVRLAIMEKCIDIRSNYIYNVLNDGTSYTSLVICYCLMAVSVIIGLVFYACGSIGWCVLSMISVFVELSAYLCFVTVYSLMSDSKRGKVDW